MAMRKVENLPNPSFRFLEKMVTVSKCGWDLSEFQEQSYKTKEMIIGGKWNDGVEIQN